MLLLTRSATPQMRRYGDKRTRVQARDKEFLNLVAWNVRTTNDSEDSIRPEFATAIICREIERANVDISALSEVRRPDSGNIKEKSHTIVLEWWCR